MRHPAKRSQGRGQSAIEPPFDYCQPLHMTNRDSLTPEQYREAVLRARAMTPEERIAECFRLTDEYMREVAAMSEEDRAHWRAEREREDDLIFGPPFPISEVLQTKQNED